jgi:hypothetical protein
MNKFKRGYALKAAGLLLMMAALAAVLFLGPALRRAPDPGPPMQLPAMTNIPPEGSLHIETAAEGAPQAAATEIEAVVEAEAEPE